MRMRWGRLLPHLAALIVIAVTVVGLLLEANASALVSPRGGRGAASPPVPNTAVGALFSNVGGHLGRHFCTASVVASASGNVLVTAAHCLSGVSLAAPGGVVFAPGYHNGRFPLGLWTVTGAFTTTNWNASRDPNDDVAFLVVSSDRRRSVQEVAGADPLGLGTSLPATIEAIGYPDTANRPVSCSALALDFSSPGLRQITFTCGGFTDGTSGGPLLSDVNPATGHGTIIGVIGGYQQGGDTASVSYSAKFAKNVAALYQMATSPTRDPAHRHDPV